MWAEMQIALAEVEVATLNSSHVFGASHAKALEALRTSQLALAQAWAKSGEGTMGDSLKAFDGEEAEIDAAAPPKEETLGPATPAIAKKEKDADKDKDKKDDAGKGSSAKNLEEETERDIILARKRREANDRYFQQVNSGVLDVVSKLEEVATAMRRVEKESREIWNESDGSGLGGSGGGGGGREGAGGADDSGADSVTEETTTTSALTDSPVSVKR